MAKTDQEKRDDELSVAITRVLYPVITCMVLAVVLIRLVEPKDRNCLNKRPQGDILTAFPSASSSSSSTENIYEGLGGVIFIIIFFSCMVLFTFALMYLYKKGYVKAIQAWLLFSVLLIFAYVGGVYLYELCRSRCIDLDWITLVFITWNFSITGMIAVFGTVPRLVNQGYLVVMSALMAYIFRRLPEWATWIILGLLVLWDLFAVLTPCGPLRKLVEMARERGDPLPALVYDTNPAAVGRDDEAQPAVQWKSREQRRRLREEKNAQREPNTATREGASAGAANNEPGSKTPKPSRQEKKAARQQAKEERKRNGPQTRPAPQNTEPEAVGTLGHHLKLGLGDFVFYSILVAQASESGMAAAFVSFVAILTGLCATLFLVTVYKKALPALPISIVLGLVFFYLSRFAIKPFVEQLLSELVFH